MKKLIILIPVLLFICCSKPSTPQPQSTPSPLIGTWVQDSVYSDHQTTCDYCGGWYDRVTFGATTFVNYSAAYPNGQGDETYSVSGNSLTTSGQSGGEIMPGGWNIYIFTLTGNLLKLSNTSVSNNPYYAYYHKQ